jgi:hypothetical protein
MGDLRERARYLADEILFPAALATDVAARRLPRRTRSR